MRALNAFTGGFYLETLQVARYTREMYCLFGGRHTHPSTIMPAVAAPTSRTRRSRTTTCG